MFTRIKSFCTFAVAAMMLNPLFVLGNDLAAQKQYSCKQVSSQAVAETFGFDKSQVVLTPDDDGSCEIFFDKLGLSSLRISFVHYPSAVDVKNEFQSNIQFPAGQKIEVIPDLGEIAYLTSLDDLSISKSSTMPGHPEGGQLSHGESRELKIAEGNYEISLEYNGAVIAKPEEAVKIALISLGCSLLRL